jgi:hypothetical protein
MKNFLVMMSMNMLPIILALLAFYMVYADKPYWGWVIVAAVLTLVYPKQIKY